MATFRVVQSEKVKEDPNNVYGDWRSRVIVFLEGVLNMNIEHVDNVSDKELRVTFAKGQDFSVLSGKFEEFFIAEENKHNSVRRRAIRSSSAYAKAVRFDENWVWAEAGDFELKLKKWLDDNKAEFKSSGKLLDARSADSPEDFFD